MSQRHRCGMHSGVNDTAMHCAAKSYFRIKKKHTHCFVSFAKIFEAMLEKALARVSGAQVKLFDEKKTRGRK
jgi:hypothetical protein